MDDDEDDHLDRQTRCATMPRAIPAARAPIANIKNTKLTLMTSTMPHEIAAGSTATNSSPCLLLGHTGRPPATIGATASNGMP